jgi:hypothetical protein
MINITEFATEGLLHNTDVTETWKRHETLEGQHGAEHQCSAGSFQNKILPDSNEGTLNKRKTSVGS